MKKEENPFQDSLNFQERKQFAFFLSAERKEENCSTNIFFLMRGKKKVS